MSTRSVTVKKDTSVLLLVDIQRDFMPGGALGIDEGDKILEPVGSLLEAGRFGLCVATQDWHPPGHVSFASSHPGHKPFDSIDHAGHEQTLWPDHCVQGTSGAEFFPELDWRRVAAVIRKGQERESDSYSGFRNNWNLRGERPPTGLAGYLKERGIRQVFVCGLARDVCALWTAEDAAKEGFEVAFLWEATRSVEPEKDDRVRRALEKHGVVIVESIESLLTPVSAGEGGKTGV